jgi:hypothetical protein
MLNIFYNKNLPVVNSVPTIGITWHSYLNGRNPGLILIAATLLLLSSCRSEIVPEPFLPRSEHEAYLHSLEQANLIKTAIGHDWKEASENSLSKPVDIKLPFEEQFYLDPKGVEAGGYRFFVLRGKNRSRNNCIILPASIERKLNRDLNRSSCLKVLSQAFLRLKPMTSFEG